MAITQEGTTAITVDTTLVVDYTTINREREFHNEETCTYWLPKDEEEQQRLTGQHFALKELFEGNLSRSVQKNLDFEKGISVLDVGCGPGAWIMDMTQDYPNCTYHGCDIVDVTNKNLKIDQFTFNFGNVIQGLPYEDNTFDFVQMRLFTAALRKEEWPIALKEIIRLTKPGGMIQLMEPDFRLSEDDSSAYNKFIKALDSVCTSKGQDLHITYQLEKLLLETRLVKVTEHDTRHCNMNSNTATAKKFAWDFIELAKGTILGIKPLMGISSEEEISKFLNELRHCLTHTDIHLYVNRISVQKL
ncbi:hypothetical protein G6F37_008659 [Rhizopus arrhizus]|nr:hypothetical protein G6F38_000477 [Rhizopus arrhizus]KAG1155305.1 hypothetical protein G6F37_008659 [Rhizopus arrhizus]